MPTNQPKVFIGMRDRHIVEILETRIAPASLFVWDGGAGDGKWTTAANWVGDLAPTPGSALLFQPAIPETVSNDFPIGTEFDSLSFANRPYIVTVTGNQVVLANGINPSGFGSGAFLDLPIKLAADQTFFTDGALYLAHPRVKDFNGHSLTLAGAGRFEFSGEFVDTSGTGEGELHYSGTGSLHVSGGGETAPARIVASGPSLEEYASLPQTTLVLNGGILKGNGEIASIISKGATLQGEYYFGRVQFVVNDDFAMDAASTLNVRLSPSYSAFDGVLDVKGTVTLGNAAFNVRVFSQPRSGDEFRIINNEGPDPVAGTFAGLPEGALFNALGVQFENEPDIVMGTNVQFRISYQGGDGNDVVLTADFPEVQVSEDGRIATFTDFDGDAVTIKTKFGRLDPRDFWLVRSGDVGGAQLARIDFESDPIPTDLTGTNLKIIAAPGEQGGDGRVNVGGLEARFAFNNVLIDGDLGYAALGASSKNIPLAADHFRVQSLGAFGVTTQLPGLHSGNYLGFAGGVNELKVEDDVEAWISGRFFDRISVGGSIIGGADDWSGSIHASSAIGLVKIGGDLIGGQGVQSGSIVAGTAVARKPSFGINTVVIGGSLVGGEADGTGSIQAVFGSVGNVTIGGSFVTEAEELLAGDAAIIAQAQIGSIRVFGEIAGKSSNPVLIVAGGSIPWPTDGINRAIHALEVRGSVRHAQIYAGYNSIFYPGGSAQPLTPVDADVSIGTIQVGGDWTASTAVAGVARGPDGFFGTGDDARVSGTRVRDFAEITSEIATIIIHGAANGTARAGDSFGFVAEEIGAAEIDGQRFAFASGPRDSKDVYFVGAMGPGPTGGSTDLALREATK